MVSWELFSETIEFCEEHCMKFCIIQLVLPNYKKLVCQILWQLLKLPKLYIHSSANCNILSPHIKIKKKIKFLLWLPHVPGCVICLSRLFRGKQAISDLKLVGFHNFAPALRILCKFSIKKEAKNVFFERNGLFQATKWFS